MTKLTHWDAHLALEWHCKITTISVGPKSAGPVNALPQVLLQDAKACNMHDMIHTYRSTILTRTRVHDQSNNETVHISN